MVQRQGCLLQKISVMDGHCLMVNLIGKYRSKEKEGKRKEPETEGPLDGYYHSKNELLEREARSETWTKY
jgi:hypothetical protein